MAARNEYVDVTLAELEKCGLHGEVHHRAKHLEITWTLPNGGVQATIAPCTGSNWRGVLNKRAEVRRPTMC